MRKIRYGLIVLGVLLSLTTASRAEVDVRIGIGLPSVHIGINLPFFPEFYPIPGYPVYYAPRIPANYFFYDGMYWVFADDNWYASYWFNGPWWLVEPDFVPLFILRIPVFYYGRPPAYFYGWHLRRPPRWGERWGHEWERRHRDWERWDRHAAPPLAPLPTYQREYSGDRYPSEERQRELHERHYRYQPRDFRAREQFPSRVERRAPREQREEPAMRSPEPRAPRPPEPMPPSRREIEDRRQRAPGQDSPREREPVMREQRRSPVEIQRQREQPVPERHEQRREPVMREQRQPPVEIQRRREQPAPERYEQRRESREGREPMDSGREHRRESGRGGED